MISTLCEVRQDGIYDGYLLLISLFFQTIHITESRYLAAAGAQNSCERKRE